MSSLRPLGLILALGMGSSIFAQEKDLLDYSIIGSYFPNKRPGYFQVMGVIEAQRLLLKLADGPLNQASVEACLKGTSVSMLDLVELGLIRREGNRVFLNFALFTAADIKRVKDVSGPYGISLAAAVLSHRKEIEQNIEVYDAPGVDRKAVAFIVVGCASLDWDGLAITEQRGYRKATDTKPDGKYVPHADEISKNYSVKGIYWASRTQAYGHTFVTTFGDDDANRRNLPSAFGEPLARLALSLRHSPKSKEELIKEGLSPKDAEHLLPILVACDYVVERDGRYYPKAPLFTKDDEAMTQKVRVIGRKIMEDWLKANYTKIKSDLGGLSLTKAGVPFEEGFSMIWHYLFGLANQRLVEAGLFADPYSQDQKFKGYIPVIYDWDFQGE